MSFCTSLQNFIQIGLPLAEKMTLCRFSRWRIFTILDFRGTIMGSLKSPCTTSYKSSMATIALNCLVFEKIAFLHFGDRQTDRLTNKQMDSTDALSRSRCRERRLTKMCLLLREESAISAKALQWRHLVSGNISFIIPMTYCEKKCRTIIDPPADPHQQQKLVS